MDRRLMIFAGRQVIRLLGAAQGCGDPEVQRKILAIAESWLRDFLKAEQSLVREMASQSPPSRLH